MAATDVGSIRAKLVLDSKSFSDGMSKAREDMKQSGKASQNLAQDMGRIQAASLIVGGAIVAVGGASVKAAADFEFQMSRVKAIAAASESEFKMLKDSALELGAATSKSAAEVAVGMEDLAALGFSVTEIIQAMPGVISASEAAGADLASTAKIVASAINAFQLEAGDASRVADVLATTANVSAANINDMGFAFKYVAPIANSLGISMEETAAAIGIMTDAGLDGSSSGTALRAALIALNSPAKEQASIMEELGFSIRDSEGEAKGLAEIVRDLTTATEGMTDADKLATIAKLTGTEAASGMLSLMQGGAGKIEEFTEALENSTGASKEAADVMMDNLKGAFEEFTGSLETLGIKIGDEMLPVFADIVRLGTDTVNMLGDLNPDIALTGIKAAGTAAGVALLASTLVKLVGTLRVMALSLGPAGAIVVGLSLLSGLIVGVKSSYDSLNEVNMEAVETQLAEVEALDASIAKYEELDGKLRLSTDELSRFVDINSLLRETADPEVIAALTAEQEALLEASGLTNGEMAAFLQVNDELIETVPGATAKITDQGNALLENVEAAKALTREKYELLKIELEAQRDNLNAERVSNLERQAELVADIRETEQGRVEINGKIADKEAEILGMKDMLADKNDELTWAEQQALTHRIGEEEKVLQKLRDQLAKKSDGLVEDTKALREVEKKLGKLDEVTRKLVDIELQQAGITAEKGEGIKAIDTEIDRLRKQKTQMEFSTSAAMKQTDEYKNGIKQIDGQISKLETTRSRVSGIISEARTMNAELGRAINKRVNITQYTRTGASISQYHTGGIVGKEPLPKLHTGGLASQLQSAPLHNEVDARLLKNEMVLTEAQQSNLMRMIDAGHTRAGTGGDNSDDIRQLRDIVERLIDRPVQLKVDLEGREVADVVYPYIDSEMSTRTRLAERTRGIRR
ncbi:phage tail tape measure protein [Sutcliffiella horikoshii]|uniref:phage tail tape measure protein n=1 Tax=Sutcliffiella horikoshii TaxID=79883 RepID=UPI00384B2EA6